MDAKKFQATSIALLRTAVGWQSAIARRLEVESRTVRRWLQSGSTPEWVDGKLAEMIGVTAIAPWPRDEWLVGDGISPDGQAKREYIMHMQPPRFIARIVACDEAGIPDASEHPADAASGTVFQANEETLLCEIEWIDEVTPGEHVMWLEAASDAIDDERLYLHAPHT